ncbi:MAG: amidohydrolase family protein [Candidatus Aminicenantes bacterium]|jgi:predicted amidohydrolase YtcJ
MTQKISIPLLKDHHNHLSFYGLLHDCLNLQAIKDKKDALRRMQGLDQEKVSVVIGWNTGYYNLTNHDLDSLPPVIIVNISLHSFLVSSAAEAILEGKYPEIVTNYKDPHWYEDHMPQMLIFLANQMQPSEEKFKRYFDFLLQRGVYYAAEMHLANETIFSILRASPFARRTAFWTDLDTYKTLSPGVQKEIKGIKFFTDGAVGARTAALEQPYKDGKKGYLLFPDETLYQMMAKAAALEKSAAVHAIGEMTTSQVVRTLGQLKKNGITFPRVRMEHCQFIHERTACQAKELGIILSMQPNFSTDSIIYRDRLPPQYLENNNPFRMLIDEAGFVPGEDLIFGSDGMPSGAEAALKASLFPPLAQQKLTIDEFTAGYCMPDKTHGHIELEMDESGLKSFAVIR